VLAIYFYSSVDNFRVDNVHFLRLFCSIPAFINSRMSNRSYEKGDIQEAKKRSKKAFNYNVTWTICFVVLIVFCILFIGLFVGLHKKNNNNKSGKIRRKKLRKVKI
jgi:hypothetical protein